MTQNVPSLTWQAWNKDKASYVATVPIDFTTDVEWVVTINSNQQSTPENVIPSFVLIDNIGRNGTVEIDFGPFVLTVSEFVRETFQIPPTVQRLVFTGEANSGPIQVIFSTERLAPDTDNQLAINQAGGENMELPVKYITASVAQLQSDGAKCLVFNPVANMTYSLLGIAAANFPNGYFMYIQNLSPFQVTILPAAGDTINSVFNNGTPLILYQGSSGILKCDGQQWFYQGQLTFESAELPLTVSTAVTVPHTLGKDSPRWGVWLRCKIANNGYVINDEVFLGHGAVNATLTYCYSELATRNTQVKYIQGTTLPTLISTGGANFVAVAANWRTVLRAQVIW